MTTLSLDADTAIQEAIDASIRETFSMMLGEELTHLETTCVANVSPVGETNQASSDEASNYEASSQDATSQEATSQEATVVVGLSGGLQGSVSVCLDLGAALLLAERLIEHETDHIDQTVIDAIGELGNMVVGGAKGRLEDFMLTLGLPCVLLAGPSRLAFPSNCVPTQLKYTVGGHDLSVFVSLVRVNL